MEYEYKFAATKEESPPKFVAPHHPRLDHQLLYEGLGYDVVSCANLSHSISTRNPYRFTKTTAIERLMYRMVEGKFSHDAMVNTFFKENPFSDRGESSCPNAMRASLVALEPYRQQGVMHAKDKAMKRYWCRQRVHAHSSVIRLDDSPFHGGRSWIPSTAATFHIDSCIMQDKTTLSTEMRALLNRSHSAKELELEFWRFFKRHYDNLNCEADMLDNFFLTSASLSSKIFVDGKKKVESTRGMFSWLHYRQSKQS